jgi:uroporphyrin-III C-methyltransferase/precorrin-2 dehydrogenase/sirohydrochlorin ferrochelatase
MPGRCGSVASDLRSAASAVSSPRIGFRFAGFFIFDDIVTRKTELFPIFLKLADRSVLVVGGGTVAASKVAGLLPTGARITVVAPEVCEAIRRTRVEIHQRRFRGSDLRGVWLVVSAATPPVNAAVARSAARRRLFVNAVDDPANASAYLGGVLRRDGVTVAISTNGRAPALAGLLREGIDAMLPEDLDRWFGRADALKRRWRRTGVPMPARRPELAEAITRLYGRPLRAATTPRRRRT